jgi:MFS transporter, DHA1 family, inner membrane transport protein
LQQNEAIIVDKSLVTPCVDSISLFASLAVGSAGTLILGLQPILLGALLTEKRVDFDGLALIATAEMLAIGIGSVAFALLTSARNMRIKAASLLIAVAVAQYLTAGAASLLSLVVIRIVTGLLEGGLIAVAVECVARTDAPGRNGGWFISVQTITQSLLAAILALAIIPEWGSAGGFSLLAVVSILVLAAVPRLADDYGPLKSSEISAGTATSRLKPALAVATIFTLYLFIGAIWAYLEPLGGQSGINAATVGLIVSLSLLVQVLGALAATVLEPHIRYPLVIGGAAIAACLIAIGFATGAGPGLFWLLSLATGFLWLFVVPWQISMTVAADPSRKTALLVPAAQLFGAAIGPAAALAFMSKTDSHPAAWFAAVAAASSLALLILLFTLERRPK